MAYADYEFYKDRYYGSMIPEADFPRLSERASDFIDTLTFDRLVDGLPQSKIPSYYNNTSFTRLFQQNFPWNFYVKILIPS